MIKMLDDETLYKKMVFLGRKIVAIQLDGKQIGTIDIATLVNIAFILVFALGAALAFHGYTFGWVILSLQLLGAGGFSMTAFSALGATALKSKIESDKNYVKLAEQCCGLPDGLYRAWSHANRQPSNPRWRGVMPFVALPQEISDIWVKPKQYTVIDISTSAKKVTFYISTQRCRYPGGPSEGGDLVWTATKEFKKS